MKYLTFALLFAMLFSFTLQDCVTTVAKDVKTCKNAELSSLEKQAQADACCYYTLVKDYPTCLPVQKKKVKDMVKELKKNCKSDCGDIKIDCSGKFLSLASALLMLVLLL